MRYVAKPVLVDAFRIRGVSDMTLAFMRPGAYMVQLETGEIKTATEEMCARMTPKPGDYWVIQADGYEYLNPKDVFERKYEPAP